MMLMKPDIQLLNLLYFLSSLARPYWIPGSLEYSVCPGCLAAYKGRESVRNCLGLFCLVVFFLLPPLSPPKYRHSRAGFLFVVDQRFRLGGHISICYCQPFLYLITTFPLHSKSVHHTEGTVLEENTALHILSAALSILVPLLWAPFREVI